MRFRFFSHTADLKFRAYGENLNETFANALYATMSSLTKAKIRPAKKFKVKVAGRNFESLLYNFLEEILFLIDSQNFFVSEIRNLKIDEKNFQLSAELYGDDGENYEIFSTVKAVTYNEMFVKKFKDRWVAQVVLDI